MKCGEVHKQLISMAAAGVSKRLVESELSAEIRGHLESCPSCRGHCGALWSLVETVSDMGGDVLHVEAPFVFDPEWAEAELASRRELGRWRRKATWGLAAAAAFALLITAPLGGYKAVGGLLASLMQGGRSSVSNADPSGVEEDEVPDKSNEELKVQEEFQTHRYVMADPVDQLIVELVGWQSTIWADDMGLTEVYPTADPAELPAEQAPPKDSAGGSDALRDEVDSNSDPARRPSVMLDPRSENHAISS